MVEYAYDVPGIRTPDDNQMGLQMRYENIQGWGRETVIILFPLVGTYGIVMP